MLLRALRQLPDRGREQVKDGLRNAAYVQTLEKKPVGKLIYELIHNTFVFEASLTNKKYVFALSITVYPC